MRSRRQLLDQGNHKTGSNARHEPAAAPQGAPGRPARMMLCHRCIDSCSTTSAAVGMGPLCPAAALPCSCRDRLRREVRNASASTGWRPHAGGRSSSAATCVQTRNRLVLCVQSTDDQQFAWAAAILAASIAWHCSERCCCRAAVAGASMTLLLFAVANMQIQACRTGQCSCSSVHRVWLLAHACLRPPTLR